MANDLLQYIITQEHAGYSEPQIRQALAQNGYSQQDIDAAFKQLKPQENDEVKALVQQYANQGYQPVQVFTMLTQQGHPAGAVRKAVNDVFGPLLMPKSHHAAVFLVIALVIAVGGMYLLLERNTFPGAQQYPITGDDAELSTSEQIMRILGIAASKGKDAAVEQCMATFFDADRGECLMAVATHPSVSDDRICDQITQPQVHDSCLINFVNERTQSVCSRVQLRESIDFCETIATLRSAPADTA